jgi:hypothetical protein
MKTYGERLSILSIDVATRVMREPKEGDAT